MKKLILISLSFITSIQISIANDKNGKIDKLLNYYADSLQFDGTVLIAQNGNPIYEKAFGFANRNWDIPNNANTKFRIYSMSKAFISMIVFQLIGEGKISLKDKMVKYLIDFKSDTTNKITIHNLLTHTSGIPDYRNQMGKSREEVDRLSYPTEEFIGKYIDKKLEFEPGTKVKYSNSNYYLLAVIIEKITGKKSLENLNERIFAPLEMANSGIENSQVTKSMATGYFINFDGYTNANYINMENLKGCGDIYSTTKDLLKWDQALYTEKLLSDSLKKIMFTPYKGDMFACGWQTEKRILKEKGDTLSLIRHSGGCYGFKTNIIRINNNQYTIIILSNSDLNGNLFMSIGDNLINTLFDVSIKYPKIPISLYLYPIIQKMGIEKAIKEYTRVKEKEPYKYSFHFGELMALGDYLVNHKKNKEALEIFRTNVKEYPDNWLVYADLANVYVKLSDKVHAVENYNKSLELNKQSNNFEIQLYKEIQEKLKKINE